MPELPEVETIKRELTARLLGRRFSSVEVRDEKILQGISPADFRRRLIGQRIDEIGRRGKYLLFQLSGSETLVIHLRMTGALLLNPEEQERFTRIVFSFDDRTRLVFTDVRRFGVVYLVRDRLDVVGELGVEPLAAEFTPSVLAGLLKGRRAPIKAVLLDQTVIAGIGNMYADEALFLAGIHPMTPAGKLNPAQVRALHGAIRRVLARAIDSGGASVSTYRRPSGEIGMAHFDFKVAHCGGKKCPRCRAEIRRVKVRNRSSYYCPKCQPLGRRTT
ncbi:MAG: bifunctional DNA-formamidopyrimidine glycosylase/DNA-(apurinic or apyrimidinic site) lyase [Candidatus Hadarchaeum sp.]|uniref:bifunctional DNA-formamidopyrimidine glycosylase/DNA-(apurinic or apyrimidinic site) lyase n=1 Tax=Candidatus Hadarchaeum sp. TaxID=2883567 RepID=UPI003D0E2292